MDSKKGRNVFPIIFTINIIKEAKKNISLKNWESQLKFINASSILLAPLQGLFVHRYTPWACVDHTLERNS